MLLVVPLPVVELSAHYSGYIVRIFEFQGRFGCGIRRLGLLSVFLTPLTMWLTYAVSALWLLPFFTSIFATVMCGRTLEHIEELRFAKANVIKLTFHPRRGH